MTDRYAEGLRKEIRDLSASWTSAKDPGAAANVLLHAGRFVINNADAILASIPPDPPPMASEDEAIESVIAFVINAGPSPGQLRRELAERGLTISALSDRQMLVEALERLVERYCQMVNSGDGGFWDPETDQEIIAARAALAKARA